MDLRPFFMGGGGLRGKSVVRGGWMNDKWNCRVCRAEFESIVIAQEKLFDHRNLYAAEKFWWNMLKPVDRPSNMLYNVNNESRDADKWL